MRAVRQARSAVVMRERRIRTRELRMKNVFITGGTGYMGSALIPVLRERGHEVRALVRPGSEGKLPPGCRLVLGNALDPGSFASEVPPSDTFVQLVGYPK